MMDIDDELNNQSDKILNDNNVEDIDSELDKIASDIIKSNYETVDEWLDSYEPDEDDLESIKYAIDLLKSRLEDVSVTLRYGSGIKYVRFIKNHIFELKDTNILKAQQIIVNAIKNKIKELEYTYKSIKEGEADTFKHSMQVLKENVCNYINEQNLHYHQYNLFVKVAGFKAEFKLQDKRSWYKDNYICFNVEKSYKSSIQKMLFNVEMCRITNDKMSSQKREHITLKDAEKMLCDTLHWRINGGKFDYNDFDYSY